MVPSVLSHVKLGPFHQGLIAILCCLHVLPFSVIPSYQNWFFFVFLIFCIHHCIWAIANCSGFNSHGSPWTVNFEDFTDNTLVATFSMAATPSSTYPFGVPLHSLGRRVDCSTSQFPLHVELSTISLSPRSTSKVSISFSTQLSCFMNCRRHN